MLFRFFKLFHPKPQTNTPPFPIFFTTTALHRLAPSACSGDSRSKRPPCSRRSITFDRRPASRRRPLPTKQLKTRQGISRNVTLRPPRKSNPRQQKIKLCTKCMSFHESHVLAILSHIQLTPAFFIIFLHPVAAQILRAPSAPSAKNPALGAPAM